MLDRVRIQEALQTPQTLATVVHAIMRKQYGDEVYGWDPITVALEAKDDWGTDMDSAVLDRFCAIQTVMSNDGFFKRVDAFMGICNTLNTGAPFFQVFDPVTTEEAAWGIAEVSLNRELLPFSYPVRKYIKMILDQDGYSESNYPEIFVEALQLKPDTQDIRINLGALNNRDNVESYLDEQLKDMCYQLNKIPGLESIDDIILRRSMNEYVGGLVGSENTGEAK